MVGQFNPECAGNNSIPDGGAAAWEVRPKRAPPGGHRWNRCGWEVVKLTLVVRKHLDSRACWSCLHLMEEKG